MSKTFDDDIVRIEGHDRITATRINIKERLYQVEAALTRIEKGTYGVCRNCKKKIELNRLRALPTADLCFECEKKVK